MSARANPSPAAASVRRPTVCLTFDFDAISVWLARGMTTPTPISRGEFGVVGTERILELLDRWQLPATWFIPGHTIETYPTLCGEIAAQGHEVGNHGWTHVAPANMTRDEEEAGLLRANACIEALTGQRPTGYRSPSWDLSANTVSLLLAHGFQYDSSMMGHDYWPYWVRTGDVMPLDQPARFGPESTLLEMPVSWSLDDYPHFEFVRAGQSILPGLMAASGVLENWVEDFLYLKEQLGAGVITYTFHPFVIGRGHRMRMLERLIRRLRDEGAEFRRMGDIAAACHAA